MEQPIDKLSPTGVLHSKTTLGHVSLTVRDMQRSLKFYEHAIGLTLRRRVGATAYLGATNGPDLLELVEAPDAVPARGSTGLYHFALLTSTRRALANVLRRLVDSDARLTGGSDHGVSEALYLDDPDGNGIEIYRDRPRDQWPRADGQLQMTVDPLDYDGVLRELDGTDDVQAKIDAQTVLGHMHLHVAHLNDSVSFYSSVLGFELQQMYGESAAFLSAGDYHHHIGLNTWAGVGAPPPPANAIGLRYFTVNLANPNALHALIERLEVAQIDYEQRSSCLTVHDPSQNEIVFAVAELEAS